MLRLLLRPIHDSTSSATMLTLMEFGVVTFCLLRGPAVQRPLALLLTLGLLANSVLAGPPTELVSPLHFEKHVRPILKAHCFHCHGEERELRGGLDLRLVRLMSQGGDSGAAVVPGDAASSPLWQRVEADEMPEGSKKLTVQQKDIIRRWIDGGARTARAEPATAEAARFSLEELSHWAYQPAQRVSVPRVPGYSMATPIDPFIARRLAEHGLPFSPRADRATLVRRATFDLTGLPPTPAEVAAFVADNAPDAYARLIDRLLSSPQFGVRWGRHWLDVAGYAETNGDPGGDTKRAHAWRYRDYVIAAFNTSKPIDQFFREQLAGDEMIRRPIDAEDTRQLELLAATGFLRMAPDVTQTDNTLANRNAAAAESLKVISSALLGVTVGCAQCHDHKYDPIGIDDYYRFRAIFDPVFPLQDWQLPNTRVIDFTTREVQAQRDAIEAKAKALEEDIQARRQKVAENILQQKLADVPETHRQATQDALHTKAAERTDHQQGLLDRYPMVKPISHIIGLLVEYDGPSYRKFQKEFEAVAALRATKPPPRMVMTSTEREDVVPVSNVFFRGNPQSPGAEVRPGELMVVERLSGSAAIPWNSPTTETTGRRLAYAHYLTSGQHPLAARVFVNRVWQHHFGRGIVPTPNDFGVSGEKPSHPELLDWLAADFVRHGWDAKRLHRMFLLSETYQQAAARTADLERVDPENQLFGRYQLRRLEAEAVRDAILFVSDGLDCSLGGMSVPVTENPEGKVVVGNRRIRDGLKAGVDGVAADGLRRSAFIEVQRRLPLNVLATFDQPEMTPNCDVRRATTVATQSLWLLNDSSMVERAEQLAKRLIDEESNPRSRLRDLFVRLFSAEPTADEERLCFAYLEEQARLVQSKNEDEIHRISWATLCQTLMASNRFLYVE